MQPFLRNLKDKLLEEDEKQSDLAEKIGVSINTIRGWFSKDILPDVAIAIKIAESLSTTVEALMYGEKSNNFEFTQSEQDYVKKYRKLNFANKNVVVTLIDALYNQENK